MDRQAGLLDGFDGADDIVSREARSLTTFLPIFKTILFSDHRCYFC